MASGPSLDFFSSKKSKQSTLLQYFISFPSVVTQRGGGRNVRACHRGQDLNLSTREGRRVIITELITLQNQFAPFRVERFCYYNL